MRVKGIWKKTEQKDQTTGHRDVKEGKWNPPVMSACQREKRRKKIVLNQELTDKMEARSSSMWKGNMNTWQRCCQKWKIVMAKRVERERMKCRARQAVQWFKRPQHGDSCHMEMGCRISNLIFPPRSEPYQKFFLESGDGLMLLIMLLPLIRGSDCFKLYPGPFLKTQPGWCYFTAGLYLCFCNTQVIWYYPSSGCEILL